MSSKGAGLLQKYAAGIQLLKEFEGCHLKAYLCPAKRWTIGWGNLQHLDGRPVKAGDTITQAVADELLAKTIELKVLPALAKIPHWGEMSAEQQGVLISFAWNLGWGFYGTRDFETISRRLRERDWTRVPEALLLYRNPGSSFEAGLKRRRIAEGNLWAAGSSKAAGGAAAKQSAHVAAEAPAIFQLEALQNTWLKKEPLPSEQLGDRQKVAVHKGKSYGVLKLEELPAQGHARVELGGGAGTWFIYGPHWAREQKRSGEALLAQVDWSDFDCLVTPSLTVGEILQWDRRRTPGPNAAVRQRLLETAAEFQKLRDAWGRPLGVTSFYRPEPINSQVGGVKGSRHITGQAMDIYPTTASLQDFYQWIRVRWRGGLGDGRHRGFIHLDTDGGGFVPGGGATPAASWTY